MNAERSKSGKNGGWGKLPPPRPPPENDNASNSSACEVPRVATIASTFGEPESFCTTTASRPALSNADTMIAPTKPNQYGTP